MELVLEAPVFRPTEDEFANPLAYIQKIFHEGERAGICKIIPPASWSPPFAVETDSFRFRTRVQTVNKIDGIARVEREFMTELRKYLFRKGAALGSDGPLPVVPGGPETGPAPLRLYRLCVAVREHGGGPAVAAFKRWPQVAKSMFGSLPGVEAKEIRDTEPVLAKAFERYLATFMIEHCDPQVKEAPPSPAPQSEIRLSPLACPRFEESQEEHLKAALRGSAEASLKAAMAGVIHAQSVDSVEAAAACVHEIGWALDAPDSDASTVGDSFFTMVAAPLQKAKESPRAAQKLETIVMDSGKRKIVSSSNQEAACTVPSVRVSSVPTTAGSPSREPPSKIFKSEPKSSEPSMRRLAERRRRLANPYGSPELPEIYISATFFKYYKDLDACLTGKVMSYSARNDTFEVRYSSDNGATFDYSHREDLSAESVQMLLASGETEELAREAFIEGICQVCLRADHPEQLMLCDQCNFTYHTCCLPEPLRAVPTGDWFCTVCLNESPEESDDDEDSADDTDAEGVEQQASGGKMSGGGRMGGRMSSSADNKGRMSSSPVFSSDAEGGLSWLPFAVRRKLALFGFDQGEEFSLKEYQAMATGVQKRYTDSGLAQANPLIKEACAFSGTERGERALEREYWRTVSHVSRCDPELDDIKVNYGSDIDTGEKGSGFPTERSLRPLRDQIKALKEKFKGSQLPPKALEKYKDLVARLEQQTKYASSGWNLNVFPKLDGSLLQFVDEDITGVIVPWLYVGMFFSSFCWHTEDHYFASINYHHWGEPKIWYGVPAEGASHFERAARLMTPELFQARQDILTGIVTQYNPSELARLGTPVFHCTQRKGEFVLTFPQAYHGGFNQGINCAEAVNFATERWIPFGVRCVSRYASLRKNPVISHDSFLLSLAYFVAHVNDKDNLVSDATKGYAITLSRTILPYLVEVRSRELATRTALLQLGLPVVTKPQLSAADEVDLKSALARNAVSVDAAQRKGSPGKAHVITGRERTTRPAAMGRMGGAADHFKQVQCSLCKCFCALSYIEVSTSEPPQVSSTVQENGPSHEIGESPSMTTSPEDPALEDSQTSAKPASQVVPVNAPKSRTFCPEHGSKIALESSQPEARLSSRLVEVTSDEQLVQIVERLALVISGLFRWRKLAWSVLMDAADAESSPTWPYSAEATQELLDLATPDQPQLRPDVPGGTGLLVATHREHWENRTRNNFDLAKAQRVVARCSEFYLLETHPEVALFKKRLDEICGVISRSDRILKSQLSKLHSWPSHKELEWVVQNGTPTCASEARSRLASALAWQERCLALFVASGWDASSPSAPLLLSSQLEEEATALMDEMSSVIRVLNEGFWSTLCAAVVTRKWMNEAEFLLRQLVEKRNQPEARPTIHQAKALVVNAERTGVNANPLLDRIKLSIQETLLWEETAQALLPNDKADPARGPPTMTTAPPQQVAALSALALETLRNAAASLFLPPSDTVLERVERLARRLSAWEQATSQVMLASQQAVLEHRPREVEVLPLLEQARSWGVDQVSNAHYSWLQSAETSARRWRRRASLAILSLAKNGSESAEGSVSDQLSAVLRDIVQRIDPPLLDGAKDELVEDGCTVVPTSASFRVSNKQTLYCVCRRPETTDFMFACDSCDHWYHPTCLATTREIVENRFQDGTYTCPTCIRDGKIPVHRRPCPAPGTKDSRPPSPTYCYCGDMTLPDALMVQCETCDDWYHPLCVGLSPHEASSLEHYHCPTCCVHKLKRPPMVTLYCLCRMPEYGTSEYDQFMICCEMCSDWFHPICLNITQEACEKLSKERLGYCCLRCSELIDNVHDPVSGKCGYLTARSMYRELAKKTAEECGRTGLPLAVLSELRGSLDSVPVFLPESKYLCKLTEAAAAWCARVEHVDLKQCRTRALWGALFQEARLAVQLPIELVTGLQHELWQRFLNHQWLSKKAAIERGVVAGVAASDLEPSDSEPVGLVLPKHIAQHTLRILRSPLESPPFRRLVEIEALSASRRGLMSDAILKDFAAFKEKKASEKLASKLLAAAAKAEDVKIEDLLAAATETGGTKTEDE